MKPQGSLYHCTHSSCLCIHSNFFKKLVIFLSTYVEIIKNNEQSSLGGVFIFITAHICFVFVFTKLFQQETVIMGIHFCWVILILQHWQSQSLHICTMFIFYSMKLFQFVANPLSDPKQMVSTSINLNLNYK